MLLLVLQWAQQWIRANILKATCPNSGFSVCTYQHFLSYSVALTVRWEKEQGCVFQASKEFCTLYTKFYYYCVCGRYASYSFQFPLIPNFQQQSQIALLGLQTSCSPGCPEAAVRCVLWERLINFASISHVYSPSLGFISIFSIFFP